MKTALILSFLYSASAFACPNLSGTYQSGTDTQTIVQDSNRIQIGESSSPFLTDGIDHPYTGSLPAALGPAKIIYVVTCTDSKLAITSKIGYPDANQNVDYKEGVLDNVEFEVTPLGFTHSSGKTSTSWIKIK